MTGIDEITAVACGAQFYRADLHLHSFSASHDVKDSAMTASSIVALAEREGLRMISLTDHNEIANVDAAMAAAITTSVIVIPGIELSTAQGHLLCYMPDLDSLRQLHGRLTIVDRGKSTSRCQQSILECLNHVQNLKGFAVLAHVDGPAGYETEIPGASPHKADVLCHPALLGIEIRHATCSISYAPGDPDSDRVNLGRERIQRLKLGSKQHIARVLNSDAHTLQALGRNASNQKRVTRFKMDAPTYEGLRIALEEADSRVRIEDLIPQDIPHIVGASFDGGFLTGQIVHFGKNLNCIVGGRGTGKSTIFESIRCLAQDNSRSKVVDSEVWPESLDLYWADQSGQRHHIRRQKECECVNVDDDFLGPTRFEIDCFGQGEAARISLEAQTDPLALLRYLDRFVALEEPIQKEDQAREALLTLQGRIEAAEVHVDSIPQYERLLATTQKQLEALRKPEVKDLIELHRQIANEREIRTHILEAMETAKEQAIEAELIEAIHGIRDLADVADLSVGAEQFKAILAGSETVEAALLTAKTQIVGGLTAFETLVSEQIAQWKRNESDAQRRVDDKRRELEALHVQFDMSYIAKLARDEATYTQKLATLKSWKGQLKELGSQRAEELRNRWAARERVATIRDAFGRRASQILSDSLSDLRVSLKYLRDAHSPEAADLIIGALGWRTNQQPRANYLIEDLTVPGLLQAINRNDIEAITRLRTQDDTEVFDRFEAKIILERLGAPAVKYALERAKLHDLPRLQVTKTFPDGRGGTRHVVRDFSKLSLGQQQSVLLALILSADTNRPLIIDQPEDNLDGEFIYSTLVPVLRLVKERRQVIIVTHNPNVAVLGDAEQILVMKAANDEGRVVARGSIDNPLARDLACAILEGAKEAFLRRARMYGIRVRD